MESYAAVFEQAGALDHLEGFASEHGPRFYGMPLNADTITLVRRDQSVPNRLIPPESAHVGDDAIPDSEWPLLFHAGETLSWSVEPTVR